MFHGGGFEGAGEAREWLPVANCAQLKPKNVPKRHKNGGEIRVLPSGGGTEGRTRLSVWDLAASSVEDVRKITATFDARKIIKSIC